MTTANLVEIYCIFDDFCKIFEPELKNICQIEHTRHRSVDNFVTNLVSALIAYNFMPKKPQMNIEIIDKSRLIA